MDNFVETNTIETAVIPKGTVINGNIVISGRLDMYGVVNGDIRSDSQVNIAGNVTGNINAQDLFAKDSFIVGQIMCEKGATVRENTIILGDIMAENLVVDGAVQGNIDVRNGITIGKSAVVDSGIKAKAIQVSNGASINGTCSLCYADVDLSEVFPVVEEPEDLAEPDVEEDTAVEDLEEPDVEEDTAVEDLAEPDVEEDTAVEDLEEPDVEEDIAVEDLEEPDVEEDTAVEDLAEEDAVTEESARKDMPTEEIAEELTEVPIPPAKAEADKPKAVAKPRAVAKPKVVARPKAVKKVDVE